MPEARTPLTRERVLAAALELADADGLSALSMRRLGQALGVEAMSLYNHVPNKAAILDGLVDLVFAEIELPTPGEPWKDALRRRTHAARAVLMRHPWAIGLMDSRRSPGLATLRHHDAVIGCLRLGGFTVAGAAHAFSLIDSYLYGFVLQHQALPFDGEDELAEVGGQIMEGLPEGAFPHFVELATEHALQPGYDFGDEFAIGLEVVLDGIERAATWQ
ncbi:Tetracycline repressor protein class H [Planctomycetes bacterium Pla163]|uniref:Tetracycline repressor protein class H n=1 Tax=Rohdeia mirabilis TaxID=2528008 RepID=A0A518CVB3_9BACT|nr:Tetracycline repressor protein class H [Planctomycetes bacterium Pla163]